MTSVLLALCSPIIVLARPNLGHHDERLSVLSTISEANSHPSLCTFARGGNNEHVLVVWDGLVRGQRRILYKERVAGAWLPEAILDDDRPGENLSPVIAADSSAVPYVAWISRSHVLGDRIFLTSRAGEAWSLPMVVAVAPSDAFIRELHIAISDDIPATVWIAWQTTGDGGDRIWAARLRNRGGLNQWELSPPLSPSRSPNLGLQLSLKGSAPTLLWYAPFESEFIPILAKFFPESDAWELTPNIPYFAQLPSTPTMPLYFLQAGRVVGHISFEQTQQGDTLVRGQWLPNFLDTPSPRRLSLSFPPLYQPQVGWAARSQESLTLALAGLAETSGPIVLAQQVAGPKTVGRAPLGSVRGEVSLPAAAWPITSLAVAPVHGESRLYLAFASDFDQGADGNVYFIDLPLHQ